MSAKFQAFDSFKTVIEAVQAVTTTDDLAMIERIRKDASAKAGAELTNGQVCTALNNVLRMSSANAEKAAKELAGKLAALIVSGKSPDEILRELTVNSADRARQAQKDRHNVATK